MMAAPVLVTAPEILPVTLSEMKLQLRIEPDQTIEDDLIMDLIAAATESMDGRHGSLGGRCLVEQEWRETFHSSAERLKLSLVPVIGVTKVFYYDGDQREVLIPADAYHLVVATTGEGCVSILDPAIRRQALHIQYKAGYPTKFEGTQKSTVPADLKIAIKLLAGAWYENREDTAIGVSVNELPAAVRARSIMSRYKRRYFF